MPRALLATGGFLCAVLWMDLMFDVQAWDRTGTLPAAVLDSIAAYYRRVTTEAAPMGNVVSLVMLLTVVGTVVQLAEPRLPWWLRAATLISALAPVLTALIGWFPRPCGSAPRRIRRKCSPSSCTPCCAVTSGAWCRFWSFWGCRDWPCAT